MALKLPKLVLPAYDLGNRPARYRHFAEAVLNANSGSGLAVTKDAVDKAWCTAVKKHWPSNKDKQEEMFRQVSILFSLVSFDENCLYCLTRTLGFLIE